jgi:hypothetical protein
MTIIAILHLLQSTFMIFFRVLVSPSQNQNPAHLIPSLLLLIVVLRVNPLIPKMMRRALQLPVGQEVVVVVVEEVLRRRWSRRLPLNWRSLLRRGGRAEEVLEAASPTKLLPWMLASGGVE